MPATDHIDTQLRKRAVISGLMLGFIILALSIFSFYFITAITRTMQLIVAGPFFFGVIFPIIVTILFCLDMRKKNGGYWTFRQAVTGIFIMFLISYTILTTGRDFLFAKLVEPNMAKKTEAVMLNVRKAALQRAGASAAEMNSQLAELQKEFNGQQSPGIMAAVQYYIINIIMLFVIAIIFAAIFKKEPPYAINEIIVPEE